MTKANRQLPIVTTGADALPYMVDHLRDFDPKIIVPETIAKEADTVFERIAVGGSLREWTRSHPYGGWTMGLSKVAASEVGVEYSHHLLDTASSLLDQLELEVEFSGIPNRDYVIDPTVVVYHLDQYRKGRKALRLDLHEWLAVSTPAFDRAHGVHICMDLTIILGRDHTDLGFPIPDGATATE